MRPPGGGDAPRPSDGAAAPTPLPRVPLADLGTCGQASAPDQDIIILLENALWDVNEQGKLELTFPCRGGRFTRDFYAQLRPAAPDLLTSKTLNDGVVIRAISQGDNVELEVKVQFENDVDRFRLRTPHEFIGDYKITLVRTGGAYTGTYGGTVAFSTNGEASKTQPPRPVSGAAGGTTLAAWPPAAAVRPPQPLAQLAPGEHPRLFFRKADIPTLRQRAGTPQGQTLLAKLGELLSLEKGGFTWGGAWKTAAPQYVEGSWAAGHCLLYALKGDAAEAKRGGALAFLAMARNGGEAGAWGNALRIAHLAVAYDLCYEAWDQSLRAEAQSFFSAADRGRHKTDGQWDVMWAAGEGLAYLAALGDPVAAPAKPPSPAGAVALAPPAGFTPAAGVPVEPFVSGQVVRAWLVAGEFEVRAGEDPLMSIGGRANARPEAGGRVSYRQTNVAWSAKKTQNPMWLYKFNAGYALQGDPVEPSYIYFYGVIDNDTARTVKALVNPWLAQFGPAMPTFRQRMWIASREVKDGDVLRLQPGKYPVMYEVTFAGQILTGPQLVEYTDDVYKLDLLRWEEENGSFKEQGGAVPFADRKLRRASLLVRRYLDLSLGDRGVQQEDSNGTDAMHNLLPFVQAFRNVTGKDVTAGTKAGVEWVVPWHMATAGKTWANDWGGSYWRTLGFADHVKEEFKPALRAVMDAAPAMGMTLPPHALWALVNYPWSTPAKAPRDAALPLVLADEKLGAYVFRSGWADDSFGAVFVARQSSLRSSVTAGDVGIVGPGGVWMGHGNPGGGWFPSGRYDPWHPGTIRIPGVAPTRGGRITHFAAQPNGSGTVTMVQDHFVAAMATVDEGPTPTDSASLGITELRAFGADTSGASGAPLLIALVDKVTGAGDRPVSQVLNFAKRGLVVRARGERSFVVAREGGSLQVTIAAGGTGGLPALNAREPKVVLDSGPELFVVITAVAGAAAHPPVTVTGTGADATVAAGGQTVRFDGKKIAFAK